MSDVERDVCQSRPKCLHVQIHTATHPIELNERLTPDWEPDSGAYFCRTFALPVTIGDGCWISRGVIILPGVTFILNSRDGCN